MKVAVLVSGGQDSTIAYSLAIHQFGFDNVKPIYIDVGAPYAQKELEALDNLGIKAMYISAPLCTKELRNIPTVEKQEIHGRNLLLSFYGALVADVVWLSALENELVASVPDKQWEFFHQASVLYTTVFKGLRSHTLVETPFSEHTKSDIVKIALDKLGLRKEFLLQTRSCYNGETDIHCGNCIACFKRWISWVNNGIEEKFQEHPLLSQYGEKVRIAMRSGDPHYWASKKRVIETHNALVISQGQGVIADWNYEHYTLPPSRLEYKPFKFVS